MRLVTTFLGLLVLAAAALLAQPRASASQATARPVDGRVEAPVDVTSVLLQDEAVEQDEPECGQDSPPALGTGPDVRVRQDRSPALVLEPTSRPQASPIRDRGRDPPAA